MLCCPAGERATMWQNTLKRPESIVSLRRGQPRTLWTYRPHERGVDVMGESWGDLWQPTAEPPAEAPVGQPAGPASVGLAGADLAHAEACLAAATRYRRWDPLPLAVALALVAVVGVFASGVVQESVKVAREQAAARLVARPRLQRSWSSRFGATPAKLGLVPLVREDAPPPPPPEGVAQAAARPRNPGDRRAAPSESFGLLTPSAPLSPRPGSSGPRTRPSPPPSLGPRAAPAAATLH
jgi:hypothetical protein